MPSVPENYAYVYGAIAVMNTAKTYSELVAWWFEEKPNREKYRLSPNQPPGSTLLIQFNQKRAALKSEEE